MKKITSISIILVLSALIAWLGFDYKKETVPKNYYQVYLNNEVLGIIDSKEELEKYIDNQGEYIKTKYHVANVYPPSGLQIKKINQYEAETTNISDIYNKIKEKDSFTIKGVQVLIKDGETVKSIYVTDVDVFKEAIIQLYKTFIGSDQYTDYTEGKQLDIEKNTGKIIENVYIENNITIKQEQISINENILSDATELSRFLLFGTTEDQKKYTVQLGDTIDDVAYANEISTEEFLISNPEFTSASNLLYPGQVVTIGITDPQVKVVIEEYSVEDVVNHYRTEERYDETKMVGDDEILREGSDGLERVTQKIKRINGEIVFIDPVAKQELTPTINKIVIKGDKYIPNVGSLKSWAWPSISGYRITSNYTWRINPINGRREHHGGIDIAGTGYDSPIYAANNGTIETVRTTFDYGNHVIINHNNGYYTLYAHMANFSKYAVVGKTIEKGQIIGYVGSTGMSTGPHIHFEVWQGCRFCRINPWSLYNAN